MGVGGMRYCDVWIVYMNNLMISSKFIGARNLEKLLEKNKREKENWKNVYFFTKERWQEIGNL